MGDRGAKDALFDGFADTAKALANGRRAELIDVLAQGERHVEVLAYCRGPTVSSLMMPSASFAARDALLAGSRNGFPEWRHANLPVRSLPAQEVTT